MFHVRKVEERRPTLCEVFLFRYSIGERSSKIPKFAHVSLGGTYVSRRHMAWGCMLAVFSLEEKLYIFDTCEDEWEDANALQINVTINTLVMLERNNFQSTLISRVIHNARLVKFVFFCLIKTKTSVPS